MGKFDCANCCAVYPSCRRDSDTSRFGRFVGFPHAVVVGARCARKGSAAANRAVPRDHRAAWSVRLLACQIAISLDQPPRIETLTLDTPVAASTAVGGDLACAGCSADPDFCGFEPQVGEVGHEQSCRLRHPQPGRLGGGWGNRLEY